MYSGLRKTKPIGEEYTGPVTQRILKDWRPTEEHPCVCSLCRHQDTTSCPFRTGAKPEQGFCDRFSINATTDEELNALFESDMRSVGVVPLH